MAISHGQFVVSDEPQALNTVDDDGMFVVLNSDEDVYLGSEKVTARDGYLHRSTDLPLHLEMAPGEILYAICEKKKATVTMLRTKNK